MLKEMRGWGKGVLVLSWGEWDGVHIRCCGHGSLRFRSYSDSLLNSAKVSSFLMALTVETCSRCRAQRGCARGRSPRQTWRCFSPSCIRFCLHIRCCGHGHLRFRSYSDSLWKSRNAGPAQSKQRAPAPASGPSPRLGVPSLRHSGGGRKIKIKSQIKSQSKIKGRGKAKRVLRAC